MPAEALDREKDRVARRVFDAIDEALVAASRGRWRWAKRRRNDARLEFEKSRHSPELARRAFDEW